MVVTCASELPEPSLSPDKIESISLDNEKAILYHDQNPDGSPRDEIVVKNPINGLEIIIAGYGETLQQVISSFRFIR